MGILTWIFFGLIAGLLARFLMPGEEPEGFIITTMLGVAGAVLGGMIATQLGFGEITGFDLRSVAIAVGGAVLLLVNYRFLTRSL